MRSRCLPLLLLLAFFTVFSIPFFAGTEIVEAFDEEEIGELERSLLPPTGKGFPRSSSLGNWISDEIRRVAEADIGLHNWKN